MAVAQQAATSDANLLQAISVELLEIESKRDDPHFLRRTHPDIRDELTRSGRGIFGEADEAIPAEKYIKELAKRGVMIKEMR